MDEGYATTVVCPDCDSKGVCDACEGRGVLAVYECPSCEGSGYSAAEDGSRCAMCEGAGELTRPEPHA